MSFIIVVDYSFFINENYAVPASRLIFGYITRDSELLYFFALYIFSSYKTISLVVMK